MQGCLALARRRLAGGQRRSPRHGRPIKAGRRPGCPSAANTRTLDAIRGLREVASGQGIKKARDSFSITTPALGEEILRRRQSSELGRNMLKDFLPGGLWAESRCRGCRGAQNIELAGFPGGRATHPTSLTRLKRLSGSIPLPLCHSWTNSSQFRLDEEWSSVQKLLARAAPVGWLWPKTRTAGRHGKTSFCATGPRRTRTAISESLLASKGMSRVDGFTAGPLTEAVWQAWRLLSQLNGVRNSQYPADDGRTDFYRDDHAYIGRRPTIMFFASDLNDQESVHHGHSGIVTGNRTSQSVSPPSRDFNPNNGKPRRKRFCAAFRQETATGAWPLTADLPTRPRRQTAMFGSNLGFCR